MRFYGYPDGSSYAEVTDDVNILKQNEGYCFVYRTDSYKELWQLGQVLEVMNHKGVEPIVIMPSLIDSQADSRFKSNQSFGLKLVCNFLNQFKAHYKIFHPHNADVLCALLNDVEVIDNSEFIKKVLCYEFKSNLTHDDQMNALYKNLVLMSLDSGGFKTLMKTCDKIGWKGETFSASKSRKYENGKSKLIHQIDRQDFQGKDILLIDDCLIYGNSAKGISKLLKERNCGKLYLAVSHMTVQNLGEDPVTNYFDRVFTTNSKYESYEYYEMNNGKYVCDVYGDKMTQTPKNLEIIKLF